MLFFFSSAELGCIYCLDICYNPEHPTLLPPVIRSLLRLGGGAPRLFLAAVMRNRPEIPSFEREMKGAGFEMQLRDEVSFQKPDSTVVTEHFIYVWKLDQVT